MTEIASYATDGGSPPFDTLSFEYDENLPPSMYVL